MSHSATGGGISGPHYKPLVWGCRGCTQGVWSDLKVKFNECHKHDFHSYRAPTHPKMQSTHDEIHQVG